MPSNRRCVCSHTSCSRNDIITHKPDRLKALRDEWIEKMALCGPVNSGLLRGIVYGAFSRHIEARVRSGAVLLFTDSDNKAITPPPPVSISSTSSRCHCCLLPPRLPPLLLLLLPLLNVVAVAAATTTVT